MYHALAKVLCISCIFLSVSSCKEKKTYYPEGSIRSIIKEKFISNDFATIYYSNGKKAAEGKIDSNGLPKGTWTGYYYNGETFWECEFSDKAVLDSIVNPIEYQNLAYTNYKWMRQYYDSGELSAILQNLGDLGYWRDYYKNGSLHAEGYLDSFEMKQKRWKYYYSDGKIAHSFIFTNDIPPSFPCKKTDLDLYLEIIKTTEGNNIFFYFRLFTKEINPDSYEIQLLNARTTDRSYSIKNDGKGMFDILTYPYKIKMDSCILSDYGDGKKYITLAIIFHSQNCKKNENNQLFMFSIEDLKKRENGSWTYDAENDRFIIGRRHN